MIKVLTVTLPHRELVSCAGLTFNVLRRVGHDCTNGGISAAATYVTIVGQIGIDERLRPVPADMRVSVPRPDAPAAALRVKDSLQKDRPAASIVPLDYDPVADTYTRSRKWFMAGGNYGVTSDSRGVALVEKLLGTPFYGAVAIHDRCEG